MQADYFQFVRNLISADEKSALLDIACELKEQNKYLPVAEIKKAIGGDVWSDSNSMYKQEYGGTEGLHVSSLIAGGDYAWTAEQKELPKKIGARYRGMGIQFIYIPANGFVSKHIDNDLNVNRDVALSFALNEGHNGTDFYESLDAEQPIYHCDYNKQPVLLNLGKVHSVQNNNEDRYAFQLTFLTNYMQTCKIVRTR